MRDGWRCLPGLLLAGLLVVCGSVAAAQTEEAAWSRLELPGLDGVAHRLGEWRGKVLLLNFWASWCPSCQAEIRHLVRWQAAYGPRGLQIVGMGVDEAGKLRNVQRTLEINYPVLLVPPQERRRWMAAWGNKSGTVPYSVVIDRAGRPVHLHRGPMDHGQFLEHVAPLLSPRRPGP